MYGNRDTAKEAYKNAVAEVDTDSDKNAAENEKAAIYLQAGAYRERNEAENMRAKLALLGIEAQITLAKSQYSNLFRVRLGPYTQSDLTAVQDKLRENGIEFTASLPR
jgi:cell division protein FtsN